MRISDWSSDVCSSDLRLDGVEALVVTHAHEDHIGAIPFLLKLRSDIPIVGSKFTIALIKEKCREHRIKPVFIEVDEGGRSTHGVDRKVVGEGKSVSVRV